MDKLNQRFHRDFERGNISENEFVSKMLEIVDHKIDAETFKKYYADIFSVDEDVISLLPILKNDYGSFSSQTLIQFIRSTVGRSMNS